MPHDLSLIVATLDGSETSELGTAVARDRKASRRLNGASSFAFTVPSRLISSLGSFTDGVPVLNAGDRKMIVKRDGAVIFHGRIWTVEHTGQSGKNNTVVTAFDPLMELGYESDDRAGRVVRDATGNFIDPTFDSPITGAQLMYEILTNSTQTGAESDPTPGEGPLPIHVDGSNFSSTEDLSPETTMAWPIAVGDFFQQLVDTNLVDMWLAPIDPDDPPSGWDSYEMVDFHAADLKGTDRSATVHFDYWTGSFNAVEARLSKDFTTICNKLYDYLGPRISKTRWVGNITPGSPGTTVDPSDSRTRYGGQFMQIREYDTTGAEAAARPLFLAAWNAEMQYRVEPRQMLFVKPAPDTFALYEPFDDYDVGDLVTVNTGGDFGVELAAAVRVYGFDVEWSDNNVERVVNLMVSADQ